MKDLPPVPPPFSYEEIDAMLLQVARDLPRQPDWYSRLARLNRSATAERRLPVYQAVRDDGCLPEDAGFFLVSYTLEDLSLETPRLMRVLLEQGMREMEEHPERFIPPDVDPTSDTPEAKALRRKASDDLPESLIEMDRQNIKRHFLKRLAAQGEREMADLFKRHHDEFRHRREKGRRFFFGTAEPDGAVLRGAVQELYDHVCQCVGSRSPIGPLACRWSIDYGFVDLQVYPTPTELVGGPHDGAVVDPDIDFDLLRIQEVFDTIDGIGWTLDGEGREFQYVCFRGTYRGYDFWVTVFAGAPKGQKPTMKSDELRKWRAYRGDASG